MPPKCKDCGGEHWMIEGCRVLSGGEADRVRRAAAAAPAVAAAELRAIARPPHVELEPYGVTIHIRDNPAAKVSNDADESLQSEPSDEDLAAFDRAQARRRNEARAQALRESGLPEDVQEHQRAIDREIPWTGPSGVLGQELTVPPTGLAALSAPLVVTENGTYQGGLLVSDPVPSLGQGVIEKYDVKKTYSLKAQRILKARQSFGLSQTKFAKLFGLTCETIYNWEKDRQTQPGWFMFIVNMIEREPRAVRRAMNMIPPKKRVLIPGKLLERK